MLKVIDGKPVLITDDIVPICSCCKQVRDIDDNWYDGSILLKLDDNYRPTHGLCQDCMKEHYPDYLE